MPRTARELLKALKLLGFVEIRQKGSHCRLKHPDGRALTLPVHPGDLPKGLYLAILRQAGVTEADIRKP